MQSLNPSNPLFSRSLALLLAFGFISCGTQAVAESSSPVTPVTPQSLPAESRGAMLYSVNCENCHSQNLHWRAQKRVADPTSLLHEVQRWRDNAKLSWTEADTREVARYLNASYYRFAQPSTR